MNDFLQLASTALCFAALALLAVAGLVSVARDKEFLREMRFTSAKEAALTVTGCGALLALFIGALWFFDFLLKGVF
jgi:hypothetical protein